MREKRFVIYSTHITQNTDTNSVNTPRPPACIHWQQHPCNRTWLPYHPHSELESGKTPTIRGRQLTLLHNIRALITLQHPQTSTLPVPEYDFRIDSSQHPHWLLYKYHLRWFSVLLSYKSSSSFTIGPVLLCHPVQLIYKLALCADEVGNWFWTDCHDKYTLLAKEMGQESELLFKFYSEILGALFT